MRILPVIAKLSFAAFILAISIGGTAALGTRIGIWDGYVGLWRIFPWAVIAGALAFILSLLWGLVALFRNEGTATRYGVIALIGSIAFLYTPVNDLVMLSTMPPIHDISTDVANAPQYNVLLPLRKTADTPSSYEGPLELKFDGKKTTIAALQKRYYNDIRPVAILKQVPVLYWRAFEASKKMGWEIVDFNPARGTIEAIDRSFWFGFPSDIVLRVQPSGNGARLDVRSKSRMAGPDMGENAERIRAYMKQLARV